MDLSLLDDLKERLNLGGMGKPALVGVVAVLVVVAVVAGWRLMGAATATEFQVTSKSATSGEASSSKSAPATLFVHVSGEVNEPGLCEVEAGARVAAAIQAAGGFTGEAATDSVNLAREVSDGEQIVVGKKASEGEAAAVMAAGAATSSQVGASSGLVNINTASEAELTSLPGVGEATAAKIVADRQANGSFKTKEDLKRVSGIGDKKYESLSELICI